MATVLLEPFGFVAGTGWFVNAYQWNEYQIIFFLEDEAFRSGRDDLIQMANLIKELIPIDGGGIEFRKVNPWQHIYRKRDQANRLSPEGYTTPGGVLQYAIVYDLLGLFLSLLRTAPGGANKRNFFLPMTAVYGQWCSRIAGHPPSSIVPDPQWRAGPADGKGDWPFMFACTYTAQDGGYAYRLGASMAGAEFGHRYLPGWRETVCRFRFQALHATELGTQYEFNDSLREVQARDAQSTSTVYGNCAECYTFASLSLKLQGVLKDPGWGGVAIQRDFIRTAAGVYNEGEVIRYFREPCHNCRTQLTKVKILNDARFRVQEP